jgi:PhnB protein
MNVRDYYRTGTPFLAVSDAQAAIAFYRRAFDAEVLARLDAVGGRVMHAAVLIHGGLVVVVDEMPEVALLAPGRYGGVPMSILVACPDADAAMAQAHAAGATVLAPVQDSFSGDRHGVVVCPFGYRWLLSTRTENLSFGQVEERFRAWLTAGSPVALAPSDDTSR